MQLTKQGYGTLDDERGMLLGIRGKTRADIVRMTNILFNFGVTNTKIDETEDVSQGLGFWSDGFAVILTNETLLYRFLVKNGIRRLQKKVSGKGRKGGLYKLAEIFAKNRLANIPAEAILPNVQIVNDIHLYATGESIVDELNMTGRELPEVKSNWEKTLDTVKE